MEGGLFGNYFPFDEYFTPGSPLKRRIESVSALILCIFVNVPPMLGASSVGKDVRLDGAVLGARRWEPLVDVGTGVADGRLSGGTIAGDVLCVFVVAHGVDSRLDEIYDSQVDSGMRYCRASTI